MSRPVAWLLAAVTLAASGCASVSASGGGGKVLRRELTAFRYRQPLDVVWPQVQRLLADRGLALAGQDAKAVGQKSGVLAQFSSAAKETRSTETGGLVMETGWNQYGYRWRAEAEPDAGGLRVVFTQIERNQSEQVGWDGVALRDYDMEMDLLRRVDAEAASRIDDLVDPPPPATGQKK
jgi:hypothetical protein